ncbi:MAG: hypothetical protein OEQ13_10130 [Acidobacteriota bacterium]|nr:hypothetical protein [Acidobacteriota bacterium]
MSAAPRYENDAAARHSGERGVSLVEALIASLLMIVGIVSIMGVFPETYQRTTDAGRKSKVNHLAVEAVERLRSLDYADADLTAGTHPAPVIDGLGRRFYPVTGMPLEFTLRWDVSAGPTDGSGTAHPDMKTVEVRAGYNVWYDAADDLISGERGFVMTFTTFITE